MTHVPLPHDLPIPTCAQCEAIGIPIPPLYVEMEAALGAVALIDFVTRHGGREVTVPRRPTSETHEALRWLSEEIGHGKMVMPRGPLARRARVRFAVFQMIRDGYSVPQIARHLDMHIRSISTIKQQLTDLGQLSRLVSCQKETL